MNSVLFVCSANQCRSPMAEALFKALLNERGEEDEWKIASAGVWAAPGYPATDNARVIIEERGLDISAHLSQPISRDLLGEYHLVLVMENAHKETLQANYPEFADRIVLFRNLAGDDTDFDDPVGGSLDRYRGAADEIQHILTSGFGQIVDRGSK
ncbi:MAG: low molecular weight protein arginine phosphatase [Anaerolineales bacterium]